MSTKTLSSDIFVFDRINLIRIVILREVPTETLNHLTIIMYSVIFKRMLSILFQNYRNSLIWQAYFYKLKKSIKSISRNNMAN